MSTDVVRDVQPFAPSPAARWNWREARNGRRWVADQHETHIRVAKTPSGFLCFRVLFPNGKHFYAETLAEAQEYAEAHGAGNSV